MIRSTTKLVRVAIAGAVALFCIRGGGAVAQDNTAVAFTSEVAKAVSEIHE